MTQFSAVRARLFSIRVEPSVGFSCFTYNRVINPTEIRVSSGGKLPSRIADVIKIMLYKRWRWRQGGFNPPIFSCRCGMFNLREGSEEGGQQGSHRTLLL